MRFIASCDLRKLFLALLVVCLPLEAGNTYGKLPLSFEPNQGQTDARVKFVARASGYTLFVAGDEAVFAGRDGSAERMKLIGANPKLRFEPLDKQLGISNYFIGNDPSKWRTNVPNYGRAALRGVYPGIDLIFYGNERQLEYDWVVAPGADPKLIHVKWEGPSQVSKNASGDLVVSASLVQHKPVILQEGKRIEGEYAVRGREVAFELAEYDTAKPLVIDPVLVYSTYLGGGAIDFGRGIAVDVSGNAYVTGYVSSTNFPTTNPIQGTIGGGTDAFVTKINASGSAVVYSTYLGGFGIDSGYGITVDASGNAYVTGNASSTNFPTVNPLQTSNGGGDGDGFVTKLNAAGSALVYSTYLGGSGGDQGNGIAVDGVGNAYVTGYTTSPNFLTTKPMQARLNGLQNAFVTKLNAAGSAAMYSTYLGGNRYDVGSSVAVDSAGDAYVTGTTLSSNFPTVNPLQLGNGLQIGYAFVTKVNAAGSALVYSTYLGGTGGNQGNSIAVDSAGNAYVTGDTMSTNFPTTNAFQASLSGGQNAFVTKLNAAGSAKVYSTYLGGGAGDSGTGIAVDGSGNAYVTGSTRSTNFPTTYPLQMSNGGGSDAFVTKINAAGSALAYSTYLGGSGDDGGTGIAVDGFGNVYVTGSTSSTNFPTANPIQGAFGGGNDAFVLSIPAPQISSATHFVPVTPCRIADTRSLNGPFGGPTLPGQTVRDFAIPSSACSIPPTAVAYSMNVAVVPSGPLGYLTLWPTGQYQPLVATLNSIDGRVKSTAAIVPAGSNGAVSVFATDTTDVILDINGYFVAGSSPSALAFYPLTPCRIADTRNAAGPLGGPGLAAQGTRSFPIQASPCGVPGSRASVLVKLRRRSQWPNLGIHDRMAGGTTPAPGGFAQRSNRHRPRECSRSSRGHGRGGECVYHQRYGSRDRHQRLLRSPGAGRAVAVHGDALPSAGFAAPGRNAAVQHHSGRECHGSSLRRARHRPGFCVQRHGGADGLFGLHHHVAAGAVPAAGGHAECL